MPKYNFSGWATRNNVKCSDGRTIAKDAFINNDGTEVPLVWNHQHNNPENVLGKVLLENRPEGVYAYGSFNDSESGQLAKVLVEHGDIKNLSIYANKLKESGDHYVLHGDIKEVSLVHAGANPEACIESVIVHSDISEESGYIYTGEIEELSHSDEPKKEDPVMDEKKVEGSNNSTKEKTVQDVIDSMTEEQKTVMYAMIGQALEGAAEADDEVNEGDDEMKHNVFDQDEIQNEENVISHSEMMDILADGKRCGSLRESFLSHGITNIEYLFPEAKTVNSVPNFIDREQAWVSKVMSRVHHTPFSRIKSMHADITADEARAKGYVKGKKKVDEVFSLLKRSTDPQTVYKKQKLDRDDVIDITDFDVVAWLKGEMRGKLDEELARAFLVGDGRLFSDDDKIKEDHIRPIWKDDDLYTIKYTVDAPVGATADAKAKAFIKGCIKARKDYKGSGNPVLYTTEDVVTDCLLLEDTTGRTIYDSVTKLATALRVNEIVTVPVMEGLTRKNEGGDTLDLMGIIVNLNDYNVGADKGGAVNMFDDFDIDYNAQKYLIETRCSGALTEPYSAIAVEYKSAVHAG